MRLRHLAALAVVQLTVAALFSGCSRTELIVPPGRPSPDIECRTQGPIPRTAFILRADSTLGSDPRVRRVTWNVRHRCLLRSADASQDATPATCPSCFSPITSTLLVTFEPAHPGITSPADWPHYRVENMVRETHRVSFEAVGAPSARYCVDVNVEFYEGGTVSSVFTTRLLTAAVHTDTEFTLTQTGGTRRVRRDFVAEETAGSCAWAR